MAQLEMATAPVLGWEEGMGILGGLGVKCWGRLGGAEGMGWGSGGLGVLVGYGGGL